MINAYKPEIATTERICFSPAEVASLCGFSPAFIADLLKDGTLRSHKVPGRHIITARALAALIGEPDTALSTLAVARETLNRKSPPRIPRAADEPPRKIGRPRREDKNTHAGTLRPTNMGGA